MEAEKNVVEIDGSVLEAGGQILRIAVSLSALMHKNIHISNIRSGRPKPGLKPQHLKGLEVVRSLCSGLLENNILESTEVAFFPGLIRGGVYEADCETAGSITLLMQVALPCALFANSPVTLKFRGGTNTEWAPQFDHFTEVFLPILKQFGAAFEYKLIKRGYYPRGGGEVHFQVGIRNHLEPVILMDRGEIESIYGWAFVAGNLPLGVAQTMADTAKEYLKSNIGDDIKINIEAYKEKEEAAVGSCSGINIIARYNSGILLGGSALGQKNSTPEDVGIRAASLLKDDMDSGACVDVHCQDQIIIFMALAYGGSEVQIGKITEHTKTAIYICEKLTRARFNVINKNPDSNIIQCVGHGLKKTKVIVKKKRQEKLILKD